MILSRLHSASGLGCIAGSIKCCCMSLHCRLSLLIEGNVSAGLRQIDMNEKNYGVDL